MHSESDVLNPEVNPVNLTAELIQAMRAASRDEDSYQNLLALFEAHHRNCMAWADILDLLPDMAFIYGVREEHLLYINAQVERLTGLTRERALALSLDEALSYLHEADRTRFTSEIWWEEPEAQAVEFTIRLLHTDGTWRWLRTHKTILERSADGSPLRILGICQDVTAHYQIQDALSESEVRFRQLVEAIPVGITVLDMDTLDVLYVNTEETRILNGREADRNTREFWEDVLSEEALRDSDLRLAQLRQGLHTTPHAFVLRLPEGPVEILSESQPITYQGRRAILTSHVNVTERRKMQEIRTQLEKEQAMSYLKSKMMLRIAHEFRTPLAVISTSIDLLDTYAQRITAEQRATYMRQIREEIRALVEMLNDINLIMRGHRTNPRSEIIDMHMLCEDLWKLLRVYHDTAQRFVLDVDSAVRYVSSDPQLLRSAIGYLLSNAVKYSLDTSTVTVRCAADGDHVCINIADEGIGIPDDEKARIFDAFHRGWNTAETRGMGLGLSLAREVADLLGGSITFTSSLHAGSDFCLRVPRSARSAGDTR